jgi:hypothetical protein
MIKQEKFNIFGLVTAYFGFFLTFLDGLKIIWLQQSKIHLN